MNLKTHLNINIKLFSNQLKIRTLVGVMLCLGIMIPGYAQASFFYRYDSDALESSSHLNGSHFIFEFRTPNHLPSNLDFNAVNLIEPMSSVLIEEWWLNNGSTFSEGDGISLPGIFLLFRTDNFGSISDWFFYIDAIDYTGHTDIAVCSNSDGTVCGGIPDYLQIVGVKSFGGYAFAQTTKSGTWSVGDTSTRPEFLIPEPSSLALVILGILICVRIDMLFTWNITKTGSRSTGEHIGEHSENSHIFKLKRSCARLWSRQVNHS